MSKIITFKTKEDYKLLKSMPFNREVVYDDDLANSMRLNGFMGAIILIETDLIDGETQLYIGDGHRRVMVATALGIEFYGIIVDRKFKTLTDVVQCVASLNTLQLPWVTETYINSYAKLQYPEYLKLKRIAAPTPYTVTTIASLLHGIRSRGVVRKAVQSGKFVCNLLDETHLTLGYSNTIHCEKRPLNGRMIVSLHYIRSLTIWDAVKFTRKYEMYYDEAKGLNLDTYTDIFMKWLTEE